MALPDPPPRDVVLAEASRQFGVAFDRGAAGMLVVGLDGEIIRVNEAFVRLTNRSAEEICTSTWNELTSDVENNASFESLSYGWDSFADTFDLRIKQEDGSHREVVGGLTLVTDEEDRPLFFLAQLFDVTDRRRLEDAVHETRSWVKLLQAVAIAANAASSFEEAMKATLHEVCHQTGWELGHVYRVSQEDTLEPTDIWYLEDAERFEPFVSATERLVLARGHGLVGKVLETGRPQWVDQFPDFKKLLRYRAAAVSGFRSASAFPVTVEDSVVAVMEFFSTQQVVPDPALVEVMEHIGTLLGQAGEHRLIEEALVENEERMRSIIDTANDAFVEMLPDGTISDWNRKAEETFGWERQEVMGRLLCETLIPERYRDAHNEGLQRFLETGEGPILGRRVELPAAHRDGSEFPVELTVWASHASDSVRFNAFVHDISDRKESEDALQRANDDLRKWVDELERRNQQMLALNEMSEMLHSCMAAEEAYSVIEQFASNVFPNASGALAILERERNTVRRVAHWGEYETSVAHFSPEECWALRRGRPHSVHDPRSGLLCQHVRSALGGAYICIPMMAQGETMGVFHLHAGAANDGHAELSDQARTLGTMVAEQTAMALANFHLLASREDLRFQSIRDPLTNLFNRRYMEESLDRELMRATRNDRSVGIIMLDIDRFKDVNDSLGHEAGDEVLKALGAFLQSRIRGDDIACRYGGEEFMLILPEATLETTTERARSLWEALKSMRVSYRDKELAPVTASFGVAVCPQHGSSRQSLLRAADAAMYHAKSTGRDRVVSADEIL